jgi:hypothetical protein
LSLPFNLQVKPHIIDEVMSHEGGDTEEVTVVSAVDMDDVSQQVLKDIRALLAINFSDSAFKLGTDAFKVSSMLPPLEIYL